MVTFHEENASLFFVCLDGLPADLLHLGVVGGSSLGLRLLTHQMGKLRDFGIASVTVVSILDSDVQDFV